MRSITSRDGSLTRPFKAVEQVTFGGGDSNMTNDIFVLDRLASSETNDCGQPPSTPPPPSGACGAMGFIPTFIMLLSMSLLRSAKKEAS